MTILGKKQMSEEDIKLNYITPVILNGWKGHITMETKITDGRINISGNIVARSKPKFADYMLYLNDGKPIVLLAIMRIYKRSVAKSTLKIACHNLPWMCALKTSLSLKVKEKMNLMHLERKSGSWK